MSRVKPTTNWSRDRYTFLLADIDGGILADIDGSVLQGTTDTNPLITSWN